jgi:lysophospholipid acyltransferase (LPLAT)-like uncharacterized protein
MKIRKLWMIKLIGLLGALLIRLWMSTLRTRCSWPGQRVDPRQRSLPERFIYVCWHENILLLCHLFSGRRFKVLISEHADGEMIAQICHHLGAGTIRGSTTRKSLTAMRGMLRASRRKHHIVVIPDGPRGPRRRVEKGVIFLASRTGLPIVVAGVAYRMPYRFGSWDKFALPRLGSKARLVARDPIHVPADVGKDDLEKYRQIVQQELDQACSLAEKWAG